MNAVCSLHHPQQHFPVPNLNRQYRFLFRKEIAAKDLYRAISRAAIELEGYAVFNYTVELQRLIPRL